jgi:F420 biosynthesis protein FbiB-like protein
LDALALTVDLLKRDVELKFLLGCTQAEAETVLQFLTGGSMRAVLYRRTATPNDLLAWLASRRSARRFRPDPVSAETIERILQTAARAPSAHNRQPWRFAVLRSPGSRRALAEAMGAGFRRDLLADGFTSEEVERQVERSRRRICEAPAALLVCADFMVGDRYPDASRQAAEELMTAQGAAMAGATLLLAAHALGLGGVWMCAPLFAPEGVRVALELPSEWRPQGLALLGYPAAVPVERDRRPLAEIMLER